MAEWTAYIGTYGPGGVYRLSVDSHTGAPGEPVNVLAARDAKTLALWPGRLAAPDGNGGGAGMLLAARSGGEVRRLDEAYHETVGPCYAAYHGGLLYTANFHEGTVLVYGERGERLELVRRIGVMPRAGCHQVLFHENLILVPCMNQDTVRIFDLERDFTSAGQLIFPAGTGPRHGVFDKAHERLFLIAELANKVFAYRVCGTEFILEGEHQLRASSGSTSAAIRLSADGRFLYTSTRGADLLEVLAVDGVRMRSIQCISSGGAHPRDINLSPDGRFLLAANRDGNTVVSFPVDRETGLLGHETSRASIPQAVWISFAEEENT